MQNISRSIEINLWLLAYCCFYRLTLHFFAADANKALTVTLRASSLHHLNSLHLQANRHLD